MTDILIPEFVKGLLIFLRIIGFLLVVPIFSNRSIPTIVKMVLSLAITYIVFFMVDDYNFDFHENLIMLAFTGFKEVLSGILMGFFVLLLFEGIVYAGLLIGFDMGLSISEAFDITTETTSNIMGLALNILAMLIFLLIDGHHYLLKAIAFSFKVIPLGNYSINEPIINLLIKYSSAIFILAVKIASPIMVSFFLVHLAAGIIARISPQLNIFFVLQPLKIGMGFALFIILIPLYTYFLRDLLKSYENILLEFVKTMVS